MTDREADLALVQQAAGELIPELTARLARQGLGELEVRVGTLRVRVVGPLAGADPAPAAGPRIVATHASHPDHPGHGPSPLASMAAVASPAVGFFVYADGLGPGLDVDKGDALGHVEMLGVRHDVRAPRRGTVRNLVTEAGEPVEYGQLLIELEPVE